MSVIRRAQQWSTFASIWHIYDATWQDPFQSATLIAKYLRGAHKPIYYPSNYSGDHVVVINSADIAIKGNEWDKRVYFHDTTLPKGESYTKAWQLHKLDKTKIMEKAVYSALSGRMGRRYYMQFLHIFPDANLPEYIKGNISHQIKQLRPVPVRLDHIPQEEIDNFPLLADYPKDLVLYRTKKN